MVIVVVCFVLLFLCALYCIALFFRVLCLLFSFLLLLLLVALLVGVLFSDLCYQIVIRRMYVLFCFLNMASHACILVFI